MSIRVTCDGCGASFNTKDEHAGKAGRCPKCQAPIRIPEIATDVLEEELLQEEDELEQEPEQEALERSGQRSRTPFEASKDSMNPAAIGGALAVAAVGALAYGYISSAADREIGYMAWGVGALIGGAAWKLGGRGVPMAISCAALALVSIFAGRCLSAHLGLQEYLTNGYQIARVVAQDFAALAEHSDENLADFMVSYRYTEADSPLGVNEDELEGFRAEVVPEIEAFLSEAPDRDEWAADFLRKSEGLSVIEVVTEDLSPVDLIFGFLGITTAFGIVNRSPRRKTTRRRGRVRP